MIRFLFLTLFSTQLLATTFQVQPIEQQIKESDGLFQGNYLRKKSITLENGSVATQMIFKMTREVGLQSDFYGMDEVIIHYPGGKTASGEVKVAGVPEFVVGEKVVLFIKSVENRYWGMNLAFGAYKVINYGNEVMLVNSLFPDEPKVGQVSFQQFEKSVKEIKGMNLKVVESTYYPTTPEETLSEATESNRSPASAEEGQNRTVASEMDQSDNSSNGLPHMSVMWLILALGIAGGIFRFSNRKISK